MNILCSLSTFNGIVPDPSIHINISGEIPMWSGKDIAYPILFQKILILIWKIVPMK